MQNAETPRYLDCGDRRIDLSSPIIMGVLNVTPDSFSDGGKFTSVDIAVQHAQQMEEEGAAIIDVGGESTRPDAAPITVEEEMNRVVPVLKALQGRITTPISIDTSHPEVMKAALDLGACIINDVRALTLPGAMEVAAESKAGICLMHMLGDPKTMQHEPSYIDVVQEVKQYLADRVAACEAAGISRDRIIIDPGFGFGKNVQHNLTLIQNLGEFKDLQIPILVGVSKKTTIGKVLDQTVDKRLYGSIGLDVLSVIKGASIIRCHEVRPSIEALKMVTETLKA